MSPAEYSLAALFFGTALLYALGGFAGGSTYLALLALFGIPFQQIGILALSCNLIVATQGGYQAQRSGLNPVRITLPFLLTSIPASFFAARYPLSEKSFFILLGLALTIATLRLLWNFSDMAPRQIATREAWGTGLPVGLVLGTLAGLTGIGGGIFLSPVLHLKRWADAKTIAAMTSVFIFGNSLAGLLGKIPKADQWPRLELCVALWLAVLVGGAVGSSLTYKTLNFKSVRQWSSVLILSAAIRAFWQSFTGG